MAHGTALARIRGIPPWTWGVPAYLAAYVLFDWASYIRPFAGLNITPWNPQQALAIALLIRRPRAAWLAFAGLVLAELAVRGMGGDCIPAGAAAAAMTVAFLGIARALRRSLNESIPLASHGELLRFAAIVTIGSLVSAVLYVSIRASASWAGPTGVYELILRYWVGDTVALLVTLPLLLAVMSPVRRAGAVAVLRTGVWWACAALGAIALALIFGRGEQDYFKFFYLLLPPVMWAAVRFGVNGAVLACFATQIGLLASAQLALPHDLTLFELQALMAATAVTALLLGVAVDERAHAEADLRAHLRYSAAGQMAAALAHELSQPITALNNYAQACMDLAKPGEPLDDARRAQLARALSELSAQAQRAGTVTRRLRDFFRTGAMSLQPASLEALVRDTVESHMPLAARLGVRLTAEIAAGLPPVHIDAIQIAVVLRNLVANALESAAQAPQASVVVHAFRDGDTLRVDVADTGPGIEAERLRDIFELPRSGKQEGLGVGLRISRSIVEAHGGKLWAEPGDHGQFAFTLPLAPESDADP